MASQGLGRESFERAMVRGNELLRESNLVEAQRSFLAALQHDPDNVRALALLGLTYFRANQFSDARPIYEELCARLPSDASHHLNLGLVRLKLGDTEGAIDALEASRRLDPSQGRAVNYLGLAYARAGRYGDAYEAFLIAGQHDLAKEIEPNLTAEERRAVLARQGEVSFDDDLGDSGEELSEEEMSAQLDKELDAVEAGARRPEAAAPSAPTPAPAPSKPQPPSPSRAFVAPPAAQTRPRASGPAPSPISLGKPTGGPGSAAPGDRKSVV